MGNEAQNMAGRKLAEMMLEMVREDYNRLDAHGRAAFVAALDRKFHPQQEREEAAPEPFQQRRVQGSPIEEALGQCEAILAMIPDLPFEGSEFGESVESRVRGIQATIRRRDWVSEAQQEALDNMQRGVENWFHGDE